MTLNPEDLLRAQELKHADQEGKLSLVHELIVELRWDVRAARDLASAWGMSPSDIQKLSSLAHGLILSAMRDPQELRSSLIAKIHFVAEDALRKKRAFLDKTGSVVLAPEPDHRSALNGLALIAKITGLDQNANPHGDDYGNKSLDELLNIAKRKLLHAPTKGPAYGQDRTEPDEVITTGEESGVPAAQREFPPSDPDSGGPSTQGRIRGRGTRGDRDPTGQRRGHRPEGE